MMIYLTHIILIINAMMLSSLSCSSKEKIQNHKAEKVLDIVVKNDNLYIVQVRFNNCASKESRKTLVKKELINKFPLIKNRRIYIEEYLGKQYNEYRYEIKVGYASLLGQGYGLQVRNFSELPKDLLENLDKMGIDNSSTLNEYEGRYLNFIFEIDSQDFNLVGKKVSFSRSKVDYFMDTRERFYRNSTIVGGSALYIFTVEQKSESGGYDAAIVYWSKFLVPIEKVVSRLKEQR